MEEYFSEIEGFPNYVVSNYGRIVNIKRDTDLTATKDGNGVYKVTLYRNNVPTTMYVHRIVAKAFFVNYGEDREVLFVNDNKEDYSVLNLTIGVDKRKH